MSGEPNVLTLAHAKALKEHSLLLFHELRDKRLEFASRQGRLNELLTSIDSICRLKPGWHDPDLLQELEREKHEVMALDSQVKQLEKTLNSISDECQECIECLTSVVHAMEPITCVAELCNVYNGEPAPMAVNAAPTDVAWCDDDSGRVYTVDTVDVIAEQARPPSDDQTTSDA
jgi:hypothetical protein